MHAGCARRAIARLQRSLQGKRLQAMKARRRLWALMQRLDRRLDGLMFGVKNEADFYRVLAMRQRGIELERRMLARMFPLE